jgi:hypothetical protein
MFKLPQENINMVSLCFWPLEFRGPQCNLWYFFYGSWCWFSVHHKQKIS